MKPFNSLEFAVWAAVLVAIACVASGVGAEVVIGSANAQTNNRPCSAQAAAMQPRKPTLAERVAELEERVAELKKIVSKGAE